MVLTEYYYYWRHWRDCDYIVSFVQVLKRICYLYVRIVSDSVVCGLMLISIVLMMFNTQTDFSLPPPLPPAGDSVRGFETYMYMQIEKRRGSEIEMAMKLGSAYM